MTIKYILEKIREHHKLAEEALKPPFYYARVKNNIESLRKWINELEERQEKREEQLIIGE